MFVVCGNVFGNDVGNGIGIVLGNVSALWVKYITLTNMKLRRFSQKPEYGIVHIIQKRMAKPIETKEKGTGEWSQPLPQLPDRLEYQMRQHIGLMHVFHRRLTA